jgi:hypothetical protein
VFQAKSGRPHYHFHEVRFLRSFLRGALFLNPMQTRNTSLELAREEEGFTT